MRLRCTVDPIADMAAALQMLSYILRERPTDRAAAGKLGLISQLVKLLEFSDNDIEEAALGVAFLFTVEPERVHFLFEVRSEVAVPSRPSAIHIVISHRIQF